MKLFRNLEQRPRPLLVSTSFGLLIVVGLVDYLTGFNISFSVFYLLAIGFAVWFVGRGFGVFLSVMSVISWLIGDFAAGARFPDLFVPAWNAVILLVFYFIVVWLLDKLRSLNHELESRVQQRSIALTREIAERERLEKELLDISEREQRQIGHDLHDSLGQHLTSTAMAAQVLREKLDTKSAPEADDAARIVTLVEDGIAMARELARGLSPVELEAEGLMSALQELAAGISKWSKVACLFECEAPVLIANATTAMHLYRIAQEAVSNAVRHGKPRRIVISLDETRAGVTLSVEDDGAGLPENWQGGSGIGTRIMAHRAAIIGGTFSIEPNLTGGTLVKCHLPAAPQS
jgi:signal transduction histidine kinase